jgi:DNA-binding winged helix-turn-helix (wHTH) protein
VSCWKTCGKAKVVTDSTLTARLKDAGKALGDSGNEQKNIKTVNRRDYQFIASIVDTQKYRTDRESREDSFHASLGAPGKPSIAVLPLQ